MLFDHSTGWGAVRPLGFISDTIHQRILLPQLIQEYYEVMVFFGRISIVFLIGLELDILFMKRHLHAAATIAYSGALLCLGLGGAISLPLYRYFAMAQGNESQHFAAFVSILMLSLTNSASPLVIRFTTELNLATSDLGRLAICASLINDITCLFLGVIASKLIDPKGFSMWSWLFSFVVIAVVSILMRYLANWLNGWNRNYKYLRNAPLACVFLVVLLTAGLTELMGDNSVLSSFLLGVMFPREGKTARTLLIKLSYAVYTFLLPIYFGYTGFQANLVLIGELEDFIGIVVIVLLSTGGKILGTLVACHRLKMPFKKGIVIALLLNLKGHFDLLLLSRAQQKMLWNHDFYSIMLVTILLNTLVSGITVAFVVNRNSRSFGYRPVALEWQSPESEIRVLACVHGPRHVPTMVRLIGGLSWSRDSPITAYLMHLVELLPRKKTANKMYHQLEDDELSDDDAYGGNDTLEINDAVDAFVAETGITIHLVKAVSPLTSIHDDIQNGAEDTRASVVILPFHKHQRIDGKMESEKEGIRMINQRVLRQALCTVGILVDRGLTGPSQLPCSVAMQHVAVLFFGGPDDREALSLSKRIGMNHNVNLAVIRFVLSASSISERINISSPENEHVLMAMPSRGVEDETDNAFLEDFYNRYVTSGKVGYVEKHVKNGLQTVAALRDIGDMYQLFIVGRGGQRNSPITTGMSDWEECPELGTVGDLLASSEFETNSSVLVIQQRRQPTE
ncbi:hypothetical protein Nepgr_027004 [Nepenthes gracilis]|uniref:Cation/H+ exchanger domain-containing protein n=1 Tax=Nepenthes gracilis TaxID=150966 RepID=A0AAD3TAT9_NEPGR|nr:hypothetical protein Nepgr_027004 [Nepenthes gracilis]